MLKIANYCMYLLRDIIVYTLVKIFITIGILLLKMKRVCYFDRFMKKTRVQKFHASVPLNVTNLALL